MAQIVSGSELWQWWFAAKQQAIATDIPAIEVDWLLQEVSGLDRLALRLGTFKDWPEISLKLSLLELTQCWQQRLETRMPVQYLTGVASWRQFSLQVSPAVLIPRPETELLIELAKVAVQRAADRGNALSLELENWADLGTGSGAIALGLADAFPNALVHAVDRSAAALTIAQDNALRFGLGDRIQFYQGSWFEPLERLKGNLSGMVANPPYIPSAMIATLQPEVAAHEPHLALDGGKDGLDCIRQLVMAAPDYLKPGGIWLIEMMAGQAETVVQFLQAQEHYREIQIHTDLAGIERFALAYRI